MQKVRCLLGMIVTLLALSSVAWAQSTVPIFPSATSSQAIGAEFDVEVKVGNSANPVSNLFGLSFELNYTNTNFVDVVGTPTAGDFLGNDIIFLPVVNDPNGKVSVGMSRKPPQAGSNGQGTVLKVRFKSLATTPNGTQIQLTITNVVATDPNGSPITLTPAPLTIVIGTIVACPTVSGINPANGTVGTVVTIIGANFTGVTAVKFANNVTATFTVNSATQITTTVPSGAATGPITISKTGCPDAQTGAFTISTPSVPIFFSATSPQQPGAEFDVEVKVGNSANPVSNLFGLSFELNYTNTNFVDVVGTPTAGDFLGSDIIFLPMVDDPNGKVSVGMSRKPPQAGSNGNGTVLKVRFKSLATTPNGTQIQFTITTVSANDPNSGSITLTPTPFTVVIGTVVTCPTVSTINPTSGTVGTTVAITGTNLNDVTAVKFFNNVPATFTIINTTQITAMVPSGAVTGPITLSKVGCADVQTGTFTVSTPSAPIFPFATSPQLPGAEFDVEVKVGTSANPVSNLFGLSFELNYTNTNFVDVVGTPTAGDFLGSDIIFLPVVNDPQGKVSVGMSRKPPQAGSNGQGTVLKARFKSLATTSNGTQIQLTITNVVATDPNGSPITLTPAPLTIVIGTSVTCPTVSGINPANGTVGTAVTIIGANFTGVTAVKFANNVTATFTVNSATQITTTVPSGAATGPITISKTGCMDVQTGTFTVGTPAVPIFSFAASPQFPGAEFDVEVKVGTSANPVSNLFGLSFELNYTNTNFVDVVGTPTAGDFLGSDIIFLPMVDDPNGKVSVGMSRKPPQTGSTGTGTVLKVRFKSLSATPNGTQIQFTITNVVATDPNGSPITLTPTPLTVVIGTVVTCPIVSRINPMGGTVGTTVTITGVNFTDVKVVKFSNNVPATFTVVNATQISTKVPIGAVNGPITLSKDGCTDVRTADFTTSVKEIADEKIPITFALEQNYPNPLLSGTQAPTSSAGSLSTTIAFSLPRQSHVLLEVFNLVGERVSTLVDRELNAGRYKASWNASNLNGGVYFYRLRAGSFVQTKKLILLK